MNNEELKERIADLKSQLSKTRDIGKKCELQDEIDLLTGEAERRGQNLCSLDDEDCETCSG